MTVNKVILIGNLGRDPEVRQTTSGMAIANLSVATTDRKKDGASGQWVDQTEWHRVKAFGKQAENSGKYLAKGSKVYVEGKLVTNKWQDQNGQDRYTTEVIANIIQYLNKVEKSPAPQSKSVNFANEAPSGFTVDQTFDDDDIPF